MIGFCWKASAIRLSLCPNVRCAWRAWIARIEDESNTFVRKRGHRPSVPSVYVLVLVHRMEILWSADCMDRVALVTVPYQRQRHNINRPIESKWFRREIFILNLAIELMNTEYQTSHIKHRRKRTSAGVVQKAVLKFLCYTLNAAIGIIRSATSTKQRLIQ